jgi:hypothetical protein
VQSNAHEICCPPPPQPTLSFTTLCRPKISQAQNGFPRLTRLVFRRRLPVQHIAWIASTTNMDRLPTSCSPLPCCSTPIGHTTFSHNLLISSSFLGSTLPFSLFGLRPHLHKRAVVAITLQTPPSPLLCGCSQGWDVDMLVPDNKPATVRTAEHYRQYRQQLARKGVTKPMPFLLTTCP